MPEQRTQSCESGGSPQMPTGVRPSQQTGPSVLPGAAAPSAAQPGSRGGLQFTPRTSPSLPQQIRVEPSKHGAGFEGFDDVQPSTRSASSLTSGGR